jgi:hypothetical protein
MSSILDSLEQQLDPRTLEQISRQLGTDTETTRRAVSVALPTLVGAMAHKASQPDGEQAMDQAVQAVPSADMQGLSGALSLAGDGGNSNALGMGLGGLLGQILGGGNTASLEDNVAKSTGLDRGKVGKLIMMLAPIIIAQLARRQQGGQRPGDVLRQEKDHIEKRQPGLGGILGNMLDRNNDGSVLDDIGRMAGGGGLGGMLGGNKP